MSTYHYRSITIDGVLHERQFSHDARIEREKRELERAKVLSRSRAGQPGRRRQLIARSNGACQICQYRLSAILNLHHIYPVRLGGAASDRNLVAICPNCHSAVHYVAKSKHPTAIERKVAKLIEAGYTEMQSRLIKLIASHDAHVLPDGTIEPYTDPPSQPFVIVDAPDTDPSVLKRYEVESERRERRSKKFGWDHIAVGREIAARLTQATQPGD